MNASGRMPTTTRPFAAVGRLPGGKRHLEPGERDRARVELRLDEVHRRRPDERGDEEVRRTAVQGLRRVDLLDPAVAHDRDALAERHRLDLVVRHVDRRRPEPGVEARELRAHAHPELRVEVRERLVHQEGLRLAHDRAAHGHALALPAGERGRPAVEEVVEPEQLGHLLDAALRLVPRRLAHAQAVAEVLAHGHVRVERVALEHHRDVAFARRELRHVAGVDRDRALGDVLQPGDHPEQGGLAAAGRADEHEELAALDLEGDVVDGDDASAEHLAHMVEQDSGHVIAVYTAGSAKLQWH